MILFKREELKVHAEFLNIRKILCVLISAALVIVNTGVMADAVGFTPDFQIYSEAVYLYNLDTKEAIFTKNADQRLTPASLTKIMTAVIVLEKFKDDIPALSTTYISGGYECFDELYLTGASTADIRNGEKVSYKDLLYALILRSACEAANIIAVNIAGSLSGFAEMMNLKAQQLGMQNTHFTNAHGLFYENHYSTAHDLAILIEYAMTLPMFNEIACTPTYEMEATSYHEARTISHTNSMMMKGSDYYYEYAKGIKTGTLDESGRCLASTAYKDGYSYLLVTLNAPQYDADGNAVMYNMIDHKNIYEWAFNNFAYTSLIAGTEEIAEVPVEYGDGVDYVIVKPDAEYSRIWNTRVPSDSIHRVIDLKQNVIAPVKKGDILGTMELQYGGETLAVMNLIAATDVGRSKQKETLAVAQSFIGSTDFYNAAKYAVTFFLVYTILIIILKIIVARSNKKRSRSYSGGVQQKRSNNKW